MKSIVRWAISHTPAMNTIMVAVLAVGVIAGIVLRREEFPRFELEIVLVSVVYPGASPDEIESAICQKIEEAVRSVDGIKKVTSVAREGAANVICEIKTDVPSVEKVLNEIKSEVDRIPSFPDLAEEPEIQQVTFRNSAITVGVIADASQGADAEVQLRDTTESVRDDLLLIPEISVAEISGERAYQIDVEISEATLRKYNLTLQDVARRLRERNLELPSGNIKDKGETYLVRGKSKFLRGEDIAKIPLITRSDGIVLTVGDLGNVKDDFVDTISISTINGKPGMAISVQAAAREDLLAMTSSVHDYVKTAQLPAGYKFVTWGDSSVNVNDRLELLKRNGAQGLVLVFIVLALFLELRLAFWVALGIPISVLGACAVLWQFDQTLNMLSMFAFLIALGIVVDDAIVIGENIYAHRQLGKPFLKAAIDGTLEVVPSVTTSIATTVFFFMPMFFVTGVMGKFFAVMPLAVIAMLIISLLESTLILPCHLAHGESKHPWFFRPFAAVIGFLIYPIEVVAKRVNRFTTFVLDRFIQNIYQPVLDFSLRNPAIIGALSVAILMVSATLVTSGKVPWIVFPKLDAPILDAKVIFPDGTPSRLTIAATNRIESAIQKVSEEYEQETGSKLLNVIHRKVGSASGREGPGGDAGASGGHAGQVTVELVPNTERSITSEEVVERWREAAGEVSGVETLTFASRQGGPGGSAIEFKLLAASEHTADLEAAIEETKQELRKFEGVIDISDDSRPGKWELQMQVKDSARALGVPMQTIAGTVRAAYYGEEVMRLQRGRHEVKLMVRYPEDDRKSLAKMSEIRVNTGDGIQRPINQLADITASRGYSEINRVDQMRSITVTGDVDEKTANASVVVGKLQSEFMPELLKRYPNVTVRWEGQAEQSRESISSLGIGMAIAMLATFVLLTMEFNSYGQPIIVMAVIPFGIIGAIWGHWFMGLPLTLFSILGIVALTGVVVNDSIVLVDFINSRTRAGIPLRDALAESGARRFRPVLLTSLTTIAGLLPILMEKSFQAQLLIPMATSLCFGLLFATVLVLVLVPTFYSVYGRLFGLQVDAHNRPVEPSAATPPSSPTSIGGAIPATSLSNPAEQI